MRSIHWPLLIGAFIALPAIARAQDRTVGISLTVVRLTTSNDRLGDPMSGWSGRVDVPVGSGRYSARGMFERTSGTARGEPGSLCGFIPSWDCPDDPQRDDGGLS